MEKLLLGFLTLLLIWLILSVYSLKVYRFYRPGCGYCTAMDDEWTKLKSKCMFRTVRCVDINMDTANERERELFTNLGGSGVPHIAKVHSDGRRYIFDGERTADSMMKWIDNI